MSATINGRQVLLLPTTNAGFTQADDAYQDLSTPTFVLRRTHLKRRYANDLRLLMEGPPNDADRRTEAKAWIEEL